MEPLPPEPDLKQIHELCRLRSTLEAFAAVRLMARADREAVYGEMRAVLENLHRLARLADYAGFHAADFQFHRVLIESCGIPSLTASWELVARDLDEWWQHVKVVYWPNLMTLYGEHVFLMEGLESGLEWVVEQAVHQHLEAGWYRVASARGQTPEAADPVARADAFISTHFASDFDIEYVATHVSFVSASHLTRLFRQKLHTSPHARLKRTRLERGAELLLKSEDDVGVIAAKVGYKSPSHFIKDFRAEHRLTPGQYREKGRTTRRDSP